MLLLPGPRGRQGPQRSGTYKVRDCGLTDKLVASYTFDDGGGTVLHDRAQRHVTGATQERYLSSGASDDRFNGTWYVIPGTTHNGMQVYDCSGGGYMAFESASWHMALDYTAGSASWYYESANTNPASAWGATGLGEEPSPVVTPLGAGRIKYLDGTLTGFTSDYAALVTGGSFSNTVFTPSGTEYGRTKYLSPDGNTKLSYYYEMDPEMDGAWYIWATSSTIPWMDGYDATKAGTGSAWGGSYDAGYSVAQGTLQPGPWFGDGLEFSGGYVLIEDIEQNVTLNSSDFTLSFSYTFKGTGTQGILTWMKSNPIYPRVMIWGNAGSNLILTFQNAAGSYIQTEFPNSTAALTTGYHNVVITFQRSSYAKLYIDGRYISQLDISGITGDFTDMDYCVIGSNYVPAYPGWLLQARFHRFDIVLRALTDREASAWTANPWMVFAQPRLPLMAFTSGSTPAATGAYYYRYMNSLWTEAY